MKNKSQKEHIQLDLQKTNQNQRRKPLISPQVGEKMQENKRATKKPQTPTSGQEKNNITGVRHLSEKQKEQINEEEKKVGKTEEIERNATLSSDMRMRFPGGRRERIFHFLIVWEMEAPATTSPCASTSLPLLLFLSFPPLFLSLSLNGLWRRRFSKFFCYATLRM